MDGFVVPSAPATRPERAGDWRALGRLFLYGFLVWLLPFVVSVLIFPLKQAGSPLFETIMPVVLTLCVVLATHRVLRGQGAPYWRAGLRLGLLWMGISLAIDLLLFSWGPMAMSFGAYLLDIGLTYLIFPIVTLGSGLLLDQAQRPAS